MAKPGDTQAYPEEDIAELRELFDGLQEAVGAHLAALRGLLAGARVSADTIDEALADWRPEHLPASGIFDALTNGGSYDPED